MCKKIVVIGSSNVDMIMKMDRLPKVGETITDAIFMQVFGGKGANQAVAAARAGGEVVFVNAVGGDPYSERMVQNFKDDGIDTRFILKKEDEVSGHALVMIGAAGNNYLSVAPGANYSLTPEHIKKADEAIREAAIILMQYEIPKETIAYVLDYAQEHNIPVIWNFAPAQEFDLSYLKKVEILVVNESEAGFLIGREVSDKDTAEKAIWDLLQLGPKRVILTLGAQGVIYNNNDRGNDHDNDHGTENGSDSGSYNSIGRGKDLDNLQHRLAHQPAFKVASEDTTAAGDTFCGSFAVAHVEGKSLEESVRFACAASALCVTKMGAQPSIPKRSEIEAFLF